MPNPLALPGYRTAIQPNYGEAPRAMTPEEHDVWEETHSIPYRGAVDHGVTHGGSVPADLRKMGEDDPNEYRDDQVTYEKPEEVTPVPVRIVRDAETGTELRMFRVSRGYANALRPQRLFSRQDERSKVTLKNLGSVPIYVGHDEASATPWNGYRIDAGSEWTTSSDQEVWVIADATLTSQQGGWQQVMPAQTVTGSQVVTGPSFAIPDGVIPRVLIRVNSISGTSPTVLGTLQYADQTGTGIGTLATTSARTTPGSASTAATAVSVDRGVPLINTTGSSGDSSVNAEVWVYLGKVNPATDSVPLALSVEFSAVNPS